MTQVTRQVRRGVFETNSSSSHSLTLAGAKTSNPLFSKEVLREGTVLVAPGSFSWEWQRFYSLEHKLSYLLTSVLRGEPTPSRGLRGCTKQVRDESEAFDRVCRMVKEHTGVEVLVAPDASGYIDHQSEDLGPRIMASDDTLRALLFDENSCIQTGNDNSAPPLDIPTDRGPEPFYVNHLAEPEPGFVQVTVKLRYNVDQSWAWSAQASSGRVPVNSPAFKALAKVAVVTHVVHEQNRYSNDPCADAASTLAELGLRFSKKLKFGFAEPVAQTQDVKVTLKVPKAARAAWLSA